MKSVKLIVAYPQPKDAAAFEKIYQLRSNQEKRARCGEWVHSGRVCGSIEPLDNRTIVWIVRWLRRQMQPETTPTNLNKESICAYPSLSPPAQIGSSRSARQSHSRHAPLAHRR